MDNLGRLIAAERNALAAIELAKNLSERVSTIEAEKDKVQRQLIEAQTQINALQVRMAMQRGAGPSEV